MNRTCRFVLVAAVACALAAPIPALGNPMPPGKVQIKNPDGTTFTARMLGDEFFSWAEDEQGYALVFDRADKSWHYGYHSRDGHLSPLSARPGRADLKKLALARHLGPGKADLARALARRGELKKGKVPYAKTTGNVNVLVVLAKFNCPSPPPPDGSMDCTSSDMTKTFNASDFQNLLSGSTNSVADYYRSVSGGKLNLNFIIANGDWIPLQWNDAHYTWNEGTGPQGRPEDMAREAVAYLGCDNANLPNIKAPGNCSKFDFTPFADSDGNINTVVVIHLGPAYEAETTPNPVHIHSHESTLHPAITTWDGKNILSYNTEPELQFGKVPAQPTPIGVICHENGHALGLPDLYDTGYTSAGLGIFSVMASGSWGGPGFDGSVPTHFDAWSKKTLGWITPTILNATAAGNRLKPTEVTPSMVQLKSGMKPPEYFLLENRALTGYDQYLPGAGMAIYHVDERQPDETDPTHYLVDLEQADGLAQLNNNSQEQGGADDLYPTATNTVFNVSSHPNSQNYDNGLSQIAVTAITRDTVTQGDITFNLAINATPLDNGYTCFSTTDCTSHFCADGVCCNTACIAGICDACSREAGAQDWGTCELIPAKCDDGDACTQNDQCNAQGQCAGTAKTCPIMDSCHETSVCNHTNGICSNVAKPDNTPCNDGNDCTTGDHCQGGSCTGTVITECAAIDQCHTPAACKNQKCSAPPPSKPDNTPCDDGSKCTTGDACLYGICRGTPVVCTALSDCYETPTCDPATGACTAPKAKADGATCDDKNDCTTGDHCTAGVCAGTPDTAITTCNPHDFCKPATGTCNASGVCVATTFTDGTACNDGNKCMKNETCQAGVCKGTAVVCTSPTNPCADLECVPASGFCGPKPGVNDGAPCVSKNPCEVNASCSGGTCKGTTISCPPENECQFAGTCRAMDGKCVYSSFKPDNTPCDDGKSCTAADVCVRGVCKGLPAACAAQGDCYEAPTCDEATGACGAPVPKADGAPCDDKNDCTTGDQCKAGACGGTIDTSVTTCNPHDPCKPVTGTCNAAGKCAADFFADGTACNDGNKCMSDEKCQAGACKGTPMTCSSPVSCFDFQCEPASGTCRPVPLAEGTACKSANPCELNATCHAGTCKGDSCPAQDDCHEAGTCQTDGTCQAGAASPDNKVCHDSAGQEGKCLSGVCTRNPADAGSANPAKTGCACASTTASPLLALWLLVLMPLRRRRMG